MEEFLKIYEDEVPEFEQYVPKVALETDKKTSTLSFQMRPEFDERFRAVTVKELIHSVLNDELGGKKYVAEEAEIWTKNIAMTVRNKIKETGIQEIQICGSGSTRRAAWGRD